VLRLPTTKKRTANVAQTNKSGEQNKKRTVGFGGTKKSSQKKKKSEMGVEDYRGAELDAKKGKKGERSNQKQRMSAREGVTRKAFGTGTHGVENTQAAELQKQIVAQKNPNARERLENQNAPWETKIGRT